MLRKLILAAGVALALLAPAYAGDPQTFKSEDRATKFCEAGNVVWFNPHRKSISILDRSSTARPRPAASPAECSPRERGSGPTRGTEPTASMALDLSGADRAVESDNRRRPLPAVASRPGAVAGEEKGAPQIPGFFTPAGSPAVSC